MTDEAIRVLAVDDSRTVRRMISLTLERAGIDAIVAADGIDGLARLDEMSVAPDVVITDINMPRLDGFGFIERVRRGHRHADVPILVLTTEDAPEMKRRARDAGAKGWIVKPFDPPQLVVALRAVAGR